MEFKRIVRRPLDKQKEEQVGYDLFLESNFKLVERICRNFGSKNGAQMLKEKYSTLKEELRTKFPLIRHELIEVNREPAGIIAYELNETKISVLNLTLYPQYQSGIIRDKIINDMINLANDREFEIHFAEAAE